MNLLPFRLLTCVLVLSMLGSGSVQAARPAHLLSDFRQLTLILETGRLTCIRIDGWLAETPAQQAQGLMYVESLEPREGMLFVYPAARNITMWMKNTLIPLDMVFINADGSIARIETDTTPQSLKQISAGSRVPMVLELAAGSAGRWNLSPGLRLLWPKYR